MRPPRISRPSPGEVDPLKIDDGTSQEKGLEEVEHALSALAGRHPEHARLEREDILRKEQRARDLERTAVEERKKRRIRLAKAIATVAVVGSVGWVVYQRAVKLTTDRSYSDKPASPFLAAGFSAVPDDLVKATHAEAQIAAASCVVVVGADAKGPTDISLDREGIVTQGKGSIGFCSCAAEHVTADGPSGSVRILRRTANDFGGALGFSLQAVKPAVLIDSPCADEQLDGYFTEHATEGAGSTAKLEGPAAGFVEIGYGARSTDVKDAPFAIVNAPENACFVAFGSEPLSLRLKGGQKPVVDAKAIGWCATKASIYSVWRTGASPITVAMASAAQSGGLYGMRETALANDVALKTWIAPEDLAWDATNALKASGITEAVTLDVDAAGKMPIPSTRIFAISTVDGAQVTPDVSQDTIFSFCAPPIDKAESVICAEAGPQRIHATSPRGSWGAASSALPFWMAGYGGVKDPGVVPGEVALLGLARKLLHRGFEPTILGGAKELDRGVEIAGRAGEDRVVAVGVAPAAPWLVPYTDGDAWVVGSGEPRVVPLAPGAHVTLLPSKGATGFTSPIEARRTIVFRHAAAPEKK
ncbi:MAG TPA: hypothetical protein VF407_00400 [Polyangiaceae bacterium]